MSRNLNQSNVRSGVVGNISELEFDKYLSLITTLKGHEEFLLDKDGVIVSTNLEIVNITGYEEFEVIGQHFSIFYSPEEKNKFSEDLKKATAVAEVIVTGLRIKKKGGTFWAKMKIKHVPGKHTGGVFKVTLQDATHRALSNMRVQSLRDEYLAIFNNPFVGAFKFRMTDYRILKCNQKMLEITGEPNSDKLYFNNFFNSSPQFEKFITLLEQDKKLEGFQFLIKDSTAREDNCGVISARYFKAQGFVEGVLIDISEQHNQMIELQRVNSELDNFIYHASHDLRAPLTTIMGLVNLGVKEASIERTRSYFEMILNRVNHLDILLKDLISVSYNSKAEVAYEAFDFKDEVQLILKSLEYPGHPFQIDVTIRQEQVFVTDRIRLRAILRNLLSNAFNYYNPDVVTPYIELKISVDLGCATIQLGDNGIGIEPEYKEKIYDMFFRGSTQSTGTGLGLYIVKSMIEKLRGNIFVESTLNVGTKFSLTIPNCLLQK